jgi:hypothetical protein
MRACPTGACCHECEQRPSTQHLVNKLKVETDASAYQLLTSLMMPQAAAGCLRLGIFVLIAIDRIKRAGDPSIKLVDHDPVRIRMNI